MLNLKTRVIPDGPREVEANLAIMEHGTAGVRYSRLFILQCFCSLCEIKKEVRGITHLVLFKKKTAVVIGRIFLTGCFLVAGTEAGIMELSFCLFSHEAAGLNMLIQLASFTAKRRMLLCKRMSFKHLMYHIAEKLS